LFGGGVSRLWQDSFVSQSHWKISPPPNYQSHDIDEPGKGNFTSPQGINKLFSQYVNYCVPDFKVKANTAREEGRKNNPERQETKPEKPPVPIIQFADRT